MDPPMIAGVTVIFSWIGGRAPGVRTVRIGPIPACEHFLCVSSTYRHQANPPRPRREAGHADGGKDCDLRTSAYATSSRPPLSNLRQQAEIILTKAGCPIYRHP